MMAGKLSTLRLIGFDFETYPIQPGCLARAVCISLAPPKYYPVTRRVGGGL